MIIYAHPKTRQTVETQAKFRILETSLEYWRLEKSKSCKKTSLAKFDSCRAESDLSEVDLFDDFGNVDEPVMNNVRANTDGPGCALNDE